MKPELSSFFKTKITLEKFSFFELFFENFFATSSSLVNDKNNFENTIELGNCPICLFEYDSIFFISSLLNIAPLNNLFFLHKGNAFNFTPSYNVLIKGKCSIFLFSIKSRFKAE